MNLPGIKFFPIAILFHCIACSLTAQAPKRHEISLGYTAAYYFDKHSMQVASDYNWFKRKRSILPTFDYVFNLKKRFALGVHHARIWQYYNGFPDLYASNLPDLTLLYRHTVKTSVYARYALINKAIALRVKGGFLHCGNFQRLHDYYYQHILWKEAHSTTNDFIRMGLTGALNISHPIYWRFFGEIDCEYNLFNTDFDAQQLFLSYRIGFRF